MLYDPKWEKQAETKADPHSLASLIAWLEQQPPEVHYKWDCLDGRCLIGIYGRAMGEDWMDLHSSFFIRGELEIAGNEPHTFGAALDRAREKQSGR